MTALKILLVEDQSEKVGVVEAFLNETCKKSGIDCAIDVAMDAVGAKRLVASTQFDIAIFDIQIPKRIGNTPEPLGGAALVREIDESELLKTPSYVLGLTEFADEIPNIPASSKDRFFSLIEFSRSSSSWRKILAAILVEIFTSINARRDATAAGRKDVSLAIVCALESPELKSVLALPVSWSLLTRNGDCTDVHEGTVTSPSGDHTVVAAAALEPGMAASAALCAKIIAEFRPRYLAMTGIAGGMKSATQLGDVIAADVVWDYTSGKIVQKKGGKQDFLPEPRTIDLDAKVKGQLVRLANMPEVLTEIHQKFEGSKPETPLKVVFGPMFTGSAVIANSQFAASLGDMHRKIKGIDMEAYSVVCAAKYAGDREPIPIILKSVSDFADAEKNDDFHAYASHTSARFLFEWAKRFL